jgi:hypothetical protein
LNNIYIYCIADKSLANLLVGINDAQVESICYKDLFLIYSLISIDLKYTEENFLIHEKILEKFMDNNATILPFRFGTCIESKSKETFIKDKYMTFIETIDQLRGKVEVSVRVMWDYEEIQSKLVENIDIPKVTSSNEKVMKYFNKRMKEFKIEESIKIFAEKEAISIHEQLLIGTVEGNYTLMKTNNMFFSGAYLIKKPLLKDFDEVYQNVANNNKMYRFILTGPWPPYNFCNITI